MKLDPRRLSYRAPERVVWKSDALKNPEWLLGRAGEFQTIWKEPGLKLGPGQGFLLDYGVEVAGGLRLVTALNAPGGPGKVRVRFGESVSEAMATPNQDHAIHDYELTVPAMGETHVGNTGFRFVRIDNLSKTQTLEVRECSAAVWTRPVPRVGSFRCSDELLNQIWDTCARTFDLCVAPLLTDGAKRDRLVWMGDLYNEIRAAGVLYRKHPAIPESLDYLRDEGMATGLFNNMVPYTPYWFLSHAEYYRYFADLNYLKRQRAGYRRYADKLLAEFENTPEQVLEGTIIDWGVPDGCAKHGYAPLYYIGVRDCIKLGTLLGEAELVARAQKVQKALKKAVRLTGMDKSSAAFAVLAGLLAPAKAYREVLAKKPTETISTFHMDNLMRAYTLAGHSAEALALLRKYYGAMLQLGATTFWEQVDMAWFKGAGRIDELPRPGKHDIHAEYGRGCFTGLRNSFCHGWAATPVAWIMENIAGVTPAVDGYEEIRIQPNLFDLEWFEAVCPTPFGPFTVRQKKGQKEPEITLPQ